MTRHPAPASARQPPGLLSLLLRHGLDAVLTAVCTFSAFSILSSR